jgi:HSP20 family protein
MLQTWSPFRELERFRRDFDDVFNRFFGGSAPSGEVFSVSGPPMESYIEGDKMIIRADLPGVDPKDVDVTVTGDTLTLRAKRESHKEEKERDFLHREVRYGSFERTVTLPGGIKAEDIQASYQHGVLQLTIPIPKELSSRKVPIQIGEASGAEQAKPSLQSSTSGEKSK